jgi:ABC-2 type transport system ATP-binding protein
MALATVAAFGGRDIPQRGCIEHPVGTMCPHRLGASVDGMEPRMTSTHDKRVVADSAPGETAVAVRDLTKCYGAVRAVDSLTFTLPAGSITGFLGPNGAGKTTTLRLLLGLARPTTGQALVFGHPYRELANPTRRVGALLESGDFDPGRSGRNHLRALGLASGVGVARVDELLALVQLQAAGHRSIGGYSLGMRQRLGLAGALLGDPQLLILDEPANGLDASGVHWLRGFLRQFAAGGGTVVVSSHLLSEVAQSVDRVLIINRGRLVSTLAIAQLADPNDLEDRYLELTGKDES